MGTHVNRKNEASALLKLTPGEVVESSENHLPVVGDVKVMDWYLTTAMVCLIARGSRRNKPTVMIFPCARERLSAFH